MTAQSSGTKEHLACVILVGMTDTRKKQSASMILKVLKALFKYALFECTTSLGFRPFLPHYLFNSTTKAISDLPLILTGNKNLLNTHQFGPGKQN